MFAHEHPWLFFFLVLAMLSALVSIARAIFRMPDDD